MFVARSWDLKKAEKMFRDVSRPIILQAILHIGASFLHSFFGASI